MKRLKQVVVTWFVVTVVAILLTGCREVTPENLEEDYEFSEVCTEFDGIFERLPSGDVRCTLV